MTCVHTKIGDSTVLVNMGGPIKCIVVDGKRMYFEDHFYCGPIPCRANGTEIKIGYRHKFWTAATYWYQGGKVMQDDLCVWFYPSEPITKHLGGRHWLVTGYKDPVRGT